MICKGRQNWITPFPPHFVQHGPKILKFCFMHPNIPSTSVLEYIFNEIKFNEWMKAFYNSWNNYAYYGLLVNKLYVLHVAISAFHQIIYKSPSHHMSAMHFPTFCS